MNKKGQRQAPEWKPLLDELTAVEPRMSVVHAEMKSLGLKVSQDLVECMERALSKLEALETKKQNKSQGAENEL